MQSPDPPSARPLDDAGWPPAWPDTPMATGGSPAAPLPPPVAPLPPPVAPPPPPVAPLPPPPRWPGAEPANRYLPLPAAAPLPPSLPPRPRRRRWLLVAAVGCLLTALVCAALSVAQYRRDQSPRAVVGRYFAALSAGDAAAALGYAAVPPRGPYLTATVLHQQLRLASLEDFTVQGTRLSGSRGTVAVHYRLRFVGGDEELTDAIPVVRHGSSWRLARVAVRTSVAVTSTGADRLLLAGRRVPSDPVLLFPGALPLTTDNPAVGVDGRPSVSLGQAEQTSEVTVSLTAAAQSTLTTSLSKALARCLTAGTAALDCPQASDSRPVPGSLRGTALPMRQPLQISLGIGGEVQVAGTVTVRGSWQVWDFNNQPVRRSGDTDLDLHARASVADLGAIYWSSS